MGDYSPKEIEITPDMIRAGLKVLQESGRIERLLSSDSLLVADIFAAMQLHRHPTSRESHY